MKKLLLASVALIGLGISPVLSQDNDNDADAAVGGAAGGATGATVGGLVFGPIGAIIGGFAGATIGASAAVDESAVEYVRLNPTEPVEIEGDIEVGYVVPESVELSAVEGNDELGYFYTEERVYFVDLNDRTIVYSPGTVVAVEESN